MGAIRLKDFTQKSHSELEALMNQPGARDNLETLVSDALLVMKRLGYSKTRINQCRCVWKALAGFAETKGFTMFSEELCERFLANYDIPDDTVWLPMRNYPQNARTIVLMLKEFYLNGCWKVRYVQTIIPLPASLVGEFNDFLRYWKDKKLVSQSTMSHGKRYLSSFLRFLDAHEIHSWSELHPALLSKFFTSQAHLSIGTIKSMTYVIRSFLQYLFTNGTLAEDLSWQVPKIRIPCEQHLPSVWTRMEVESLLAAVDRGSPVGMRHTFAIGAILAGPDLSTSNGRRDAVLISLLYDTGARVQEIIDLSVQDVRLESPAQIRLTGKGRKTRIVPLMKPTAQRLAEYMQERRLNRVELGCDPLFFNHDGNRLSRSGVRYILEKYADKARAVRPGLYEKISPHTLRHTKAMHILQSGGDIVSVQHILGHADIAATKVYTTADMDMKRKALEKAANASPQLTLPSWQTNGELMDWLRSL